jgi:hydroxymethylglutaryl-CoA lyase
VELVEVAPRDGLQAESVAVSTETKVELVARCVAAGVRRIEVASFVHPGRVPQMADAEAVLAALPAIEGVTYIGLVLNRRGFERAAAAGVREVNLVAATTDTFAERNQGMTSDGTVEVFEELAPLALEAGIRPTLTISTAFGCPYEGEVDPARVVAIAQRAADAGAAEVAVADTIGVAVPADVRRVLDAVRPALTGATALRAHFHDTRHTGVANAVAAVEAGVDAIDASVGGIGGCPFAPGATGNVATEDVVYALERSGIATGVDLAALIGIVPWIAEQLGRPLPGAVSKAGVFPRAT